MYLKVLYCSLLFKKMFMNKTFHCKVNVKKTFDELLYLDLTNGQTFKI